MDCARLGCGHPISEHSGYGGKCMAHSAKTGLCTCQHPLKPVLPKEGK